VDKKTGIGQEITIDPGVRDKRLHVLDEEFSSALIAGQREGNTLSTILRSIWDSGNLEPLTKNNRIRATGAHIGIISHITLAELNRLLEETEAFSGFANRILWVCARRQGVVPFPEPIPGKELSRLQYEIKTTVEKVRRFEEMSLDGEAQEKWLEIYEALSADHSGLVGAVIDRAEAQVIRLSMIYALLDKQDKVSTSHLEAARAVWKYCEDSAKYIFSGREINPFSNKIMDLIGTEGMTTTEIYHAFSRHISKRQLEEALTELLSQRKIEAETEKTGGRPTTVFKRCQNHSCEGEKSEISELTEGVSLA
jgi:hypothetical protein